MEYSHRQQCSGSAVCMQTYNIKCFKRFRWDIYDIFAVLRWVYNIKRNLFTTTQKQCLHSRWLMHLTLLWRCTHSPHSSLPMFMCAKCLCVASESYQKIAQYTLTDGDSYTVTALRIIHRFGRDLMDLDLAPSLHFSLTFGGCLVWDMLVGMWV